MSPGTVHGAGGRVSGSGLEAQGLGFGVVSWGFRVSASGWGLGGLTTRPQGACDFANSNNRFSKLYNLND